MGSFLLAFLAGLVPVFFNSCKNAKTIFSIANSFAGGVFISIAFVHIMPEANETWADYLNPDPDDGVGRLGDDDDGPDPVPLPSVLLIVGYTLILLIDKILFDPHKLLGGHNHGKHQASDENIES